MARMSVDDSVGRDPKFDRLAAFLGWTRRETVGCMHEIWALCYDRVTPNISPGDINITAAKSAISIPLHPEGFAAAMVEAELARMAKASDRFFTKKDGTQIPWRDQQWKGRVYVCGASERIGYLVSAAESGSRGGLKSGESRQKSAKGPLRVPSRTLEWGTNPSSPVPSSASTTASDPAPSSERESTRAADAEDDIDQCPPQSRPSKSMVVAVPSEWIRFATEVWKNAAAAHRELQAEGLDPNSPSWSGLPHGKDLGDRNRELRETGHSIEAAREIHAHVLAVEVAKARSRTKDALCYLQPARMFSSASFEISRGESTSSVARRAKGSSDAGAADWFANDAIRLEREGQ